MEQVVASQPIKIEAPRIRQTKLLIGGKWCDSVSGKTFPTLNPATETKIADVAEAEAADVDLAVKAARKLSGVRRGAKLRWPFGP